MDNKTDKIVWITLLVLGCVDLFRGFMHTVMLEYAAANIAGVTDVDAIFLLRTFGISNYLTGALFILIALQAKQLAPYVLTLIPLCYAFGLLVSPPVTQTAQFIGKYFMLVYFTVCLVVGVWGIVRQRKQ
ncbi:MAG: hypothetical protein ACK2UQ_14385 [Anaerolineae bacterium]